MKNADILKAISLIVQAQNLFGVKEIAKRANILLELLMITLILSIISISLILKHATNLLSACKIC